MLLHFSSLLENIQTTQIVPLTAMLSFHLSESERDRNAVYY